MSTPNEARPDDLEKVAREWLFANGNGLLAFTWPALVSILREQRAEAEKRQAEAVLEKQRSQDRVWLCALLAEAKPGESAMMIAERVRAEAFKRGAEAMLVQVQEYDATFPNLPIPEDKRMSDDHGHGGDGVR